MRRSLLSLLRLYLRAHKAFRYAIECGGLGLEFGHFGKQLGLRLLIRGFRSGLNYILTPVDIVRWFEFPFALSCLPDRPVQCLDVGSPRLFSLYIAQKLCSSRIDVINPDKDDISETIQIVNKLHIKNIHPIGGAVDILPGLKKTYDCIWSISVIEHISGNYEDSQAVKFMYDALHENGRLILTVPVDRIFWDEYREYACYGLSGTQSANGKYFFQHFYDKHAIWERLLSPIGQEPRIIRWFGEIYPGRFKEYTERWVHDGDACTVDSPKENVDYYREFATYEEMPGMGICGLMIEKN